MINKQFVTHLIVAGSRNFNDYDLFTTELTKYTESLQKPILFISGGASSGADDLIIRWCLEKEQPCRKVLAEWQKYGKSAGYIRNTEMAKDATHLLAFYDGCSPGTKHMLNIAQAKNISINIIPIHICPTIP